MAEAATEEGDTMAEEGWEEGMVEGARNRHVELAATAEAVLEVVGEDALVAEAEGMGAVDVLVVVAGMRPYQAARVAMVEAKRETVKWAARQGMSPEVTEEVVGCILPVASGGGEEEEATAEVR
jgi:hypothetical protein